MNHHIALYLLEPTGEMTPFVRGISSPVYRRVDNGEREHTGYQDEVPGIRMMQHGAVYRDSLGIAIRTPGGLWHPEQPASNGNWVIDGTPPRLTIRGSILQTWPRQAGDGTMVMPEGVRQYHAVLTNGVLVECEDTRLRDA